MDKKSLERSWMKVKNQVKKICKCFDITTIKFILVGIVNTIVGTGVMFFLYNFCSVNYWIASASNYIVGSIVSYFKLFWTEILCIPKIDFKI